ncbi:MAG: hypothetical protein WBA98_10740 [Gordonia sp. (in: high G+C Gram-positive bacteria)]|uniref:hypothetical protein n=1 Tax=Gordonia sp. (in: high G+C Gram-positive bacteria) TaxID=84139 RepID=UPI003C72E0A5
MTTSENQLDSNVSPTPELRFFLPQGPQLPRRNWQHRWKSGIRIGSILAAVVLVAGGVIASILGLIAASHFNASGAIEVSCITDPQESVSRPARPGAVLSILDASTGEKYGSTTLGRPTTLPSGICLQKFEVQDVRSAGMYTLTIGDTYRTLVSEDQLRRGVLL